MNPGLHRTLFRIQNLYRDFGFRVAAARPRDGGAAGRVGEGEAGEGLRDRRRDLRRVAREGRPSGGRAPAGSGGRAPARRREARLGDAPAGRRQGCGTPPRSPFPPNGSAPQLAATVPLAAQPGGTAARRHSLAARRHSGTAWQHGGTAWRQGGTALRHGVDVNQLSCCQKSNAFKIRSLQLE
eukprot:gene12872-biopygen2247